MVTVVYVAYTELNRVFFIHFLQNLLHLSVTQRARGDNVHEHFDICYVLSRDFLDVSKPFMVSRCRCINVNTIKSIIPAPIYLCIKYFRCATRKTRI